jgi:hypothetical protein
MENVICSEQDLAIVMRRIRRAALQEQDYISESDVKILAEFTKWSNKVDIPYAMKEDIEEVMCEVIRSRAIAYRFRKKLSGMPFNFIAGKLLCDLFCGYEGGFWHGMKRSKYDGITSYKYSNEIMGFLARFGIIEYIDRDVNAHSEILKSCKFEIDPILKKMGFKIKDEEWIDLIADRRVEFFYQKLEELRTFAENNGIKWVDWNINNGPIAKEENAEERQENRAAIVSSQLQDSYMNSYINNIVSSNTK